MLSTAMRVRAHRRSPERSREDPCPLSGVQHVILSDPVVDVAHDDGLRVPEKDEVVGAGDLGEGSRLIPGCCLWGDLWRHEKVAFAPDCEHWRRGCCEVDGGGFAPVQKWEGNLAVGAPRVAD